jgi:hypothetical protein
LKSNFKVDVTSEPIKTPIKKTLERDKQKEIQYYQDRIKYFKNKIKELGSSESLSERVNFYKKQLEKIII